MFHQESKKTASKAFIAISFAVAAFAAACSADAATLAVYPSNTTVSVGNIISLNVLIDTAGAAINTSSGSVQFPTDLLQVVSVNKASSIFPLWVQDPAFSNAAGTVTFDGGVPNPGFTGSNGQVMSIVFRAKKAGTASVIFSGDSVVLANDGLGTDILTGTQIATIQISSGALAVASAAAPASASVPAEPVITSSTDPEQDVWYSGTSATFSWAIPDGVTSIQTLLSSSPTTVPTVTYDSSVSQRTVSNLADGVLYFHLRYMNAVGSGPIATYKIKVDSTPPNKFDVAVQQQGSQSLVTLAATDDTSGIASYSVQVDDQSAVRVRPSDLVGGQYTLPPQSQGDHSLIVIAYDKAGNSRESDALFTSPALIAPSVALSVPALKRGDSITVTGQSPYPNVPIDIFIQAEGKNAKMYSATTRADGSYSLASDPLEDTGLLTVWSKLAFSDSVQSPISAKVTVHVNDGIVVQTSKSIIYGLSFVIPAIILLLGLFLALYLGWHKFFGLKRRLHKEAQDIATDTHHAFAVFKEEIGRQLAQLEKIKADRGLNKREEKIFAELQTSADAIDEFIEKRLRKMR